MRLDTSTLLVCLDLDVIQVAARYQTCAPSAVDTEDASSAPPTEAVVMFPLVISTAGGRPPQPPPVSTAQAQNAHAAPPPAPAPPAPTRTPTSNHATAPALTAHAVMLRLRRSPPPPGATATAVYLPVCVGTRTAHHAGKIPSPHQALAGPVPALKAPLGSVDTTRAKGSSPNRNSLLRIAGRTKSTSPHQALAGSVPFQGSCQGLPTPLGRGAR